MSTRSSTPPRSRRSGACRNSRAGAASGLPARGPDMASMKMACAPASQWPRRCAGWRRDHSPRRARIRRRPLRSRPEVRREAVCETSADGRAAALIEAARRRLMRSGAPPMSMLYPELFKSLEAVRWNMEQDVPWHAFDATLLSDEQAQTIKMNSITQWSALPATEMFLRDNRHDSDFSAFMSVWFFEEQKHALVLMEYLRRFRPELLPSQEELHNVRFEFDPGPALETLTLHFCGENGLKHWYRRAGEWHSEPVIKHIYKLLSQDEARHGGAYLRYMKRYLADLGDTARAAFAKIAVLIAR